MQNLKLFRPSSGPAKELCSHFETTISTSPNAERGIEFHKIIAAVLKGDEIAIPEHLKRVVAYASNLWPQLIDYPIGSETEVPLLDREGEFITSGTIDFFGSKELYPKPALKSRPAIIDWKTGQERDYWMQVSIYGVALIDSLFPPPREGIEIDLTLAFVDQERHFTETFTYGVLRARVDALVEEIRDPASPYSINQYCGYCDLRGRCPAWDKERALVAGANGDLRERFEIIRRDPVALARFIVALRRFNKLVESEDLEGLAKEYLKSGQELPGLTLVHNQGKEIYDKEALAEAIKLWESDHLPKKFPVTRTPYEYLKMVKNGH